ncbi:hypothetical protein [Haloterrigena sp. YPL8]|uniref:Uncharacterized protein n=1 Tax=Natrinema halophilum TaxID=1699371 RepID=A0A7D5GF25_9EURY
MHRVDGDDPAELSRAMIDHFVETGHSPIERCDADERRQAANRAEPANETPERDRKTPRGRK